MNQTIIYMINDLLDESTIGESKYFGNNTYTVVISKFNELYFSYVLEPDDPYIALSPL